MKKIALVALLVVLACLCIVNVGSAEKGLDLIRNYAIKVDTRVDGTLDMRYVIEWEVLSDKNGSEPLTWIKVGVPNEKYEIKLETQNVKASSYMVDGSFVRLDLDRPYYKGEVITMGFQIHQSNMYTRDVDKHQCRYSLTPGWFDDIEVQNIVIYWNMKNVTECNTEVTDVIDEEKYFKWQSSLKPGERLNANVCYNLDVFDTSEEGAWTGDKREKTSSGISPLGIVLIVVGVFLVILLVVALSDGYSGGGGGSVFIHTSGGCASSCACVSSCACACACAGGGRAGCSKKDFNTPVAKLNMSQFNRVTQKKE
jgi:hypothetical protein